MKLIVYALSTLLLFSCVSAGGSSAKQDIDISQLQTDSNLQDALKYGINWIFEQAAKKYDISNMDIKVTKVNIIQKWTKNGSTSYYFDLEANNDDATITCTYNVKCDSKGGLSVVNKWNYNIDRKDNGNDKNTDQEECENPDAGTNVEIDVEVDVETEMPDTEEECIVEEEENNQCEEGKEVDASQLGKDSHLKDALDYGLNWIVEKAVEKFNISDSGIEVTKVNIICEWQEDGNTYYYFDVEAINCDNVTLNATYNVKCDSKGKLSVVNKWSYNINFNSKCKAVDVSQISKDSQLRNALIYGITWIFQKATAKFNISESGILVTKINNICRYKESTEIYYSFDVEAVNKDDDIVYTTYNVKYESKTGNLRVVNEWKYNIKFNHQEEQTDDCEDQGNHNDDDGYDAEVELEVEVDVEIDIGNSTEECEGEDDNNTDVEIEVENIEDECVVEEENNNRCKEGDEIDVSQLDKDSHLKEALDYGLSWIFKQAEEKFNISGSDVEITKINTICGWQEDGNTYYYFDVEAVNCDNVTLNATYNVKYESKTETLRVVNEWKYNIHFNYQEEQPDDCEDQGNDNNDDEYGVEVELEVEVDVEIDIENPPEECEEDEGDSNTDTEQEQSDDGYEELDTSECDNDLIKDIIDQAIEYVTCKETEKIPKDDYSLKGIVSAFKEHTNDGDSYKFEVNVENEEGSVEIDLKFVGEVKKDNILTVQSYWFHISTQN